MVKLENVVLLDPLALLAHKVQLEPMGLRAHQALLALRVLPAPLELQDPLDRKATMGRLDPLAPLVNQEPMVM